MKRFLDYLTDRVGRQIPNDEIAEAIGVTRPQLAGVLGAFGRRWANRYQQRNAKWFFDADWMADPETGDSKWHYRMPEESAEVIRSAQQMGPTSAESSLAEERMAEQPPAIQALHAALCTQWIPWTDEHKQSVAYRDPETNRVMVYVELDGPKVYLQAEEIDGRSREDLLKRAGETGFQTGGTWIAKPEDEPAALRLVDVLGFNAGSGD
jgi:hypothetical protein